MNPPPPPSTANPLCVDLDGTLTVNDTLAESALMAIRRHPLVMIRSPLWLLRGRAYFKQRTAQLAIPEPAQLPYHDDVVLFLRDQHDLGRKIILTTGADHRIAQAVAQHLNLFHHVIASDGKTNCTGSRKVAAIHQHLNHQPFDYLGNSRTDLPLWTAAQQALIAAPQRGALSQLRRIKLPQRIFKTNTGHLAHYLKAMRPHQWVKNLLLAVPMLVGHRLTLPQLGPNLALFAAVFFTFSLCASAIYLLNDLLDLDADRRHPTKRDRPIPAGQITLANARQHSANPPPTPA